MNKSTALGSQGREFLTPVPERGGSEVLVT